MTNIMGGEASAAPAPVVDECMTPAEAAAKLKCSTRTLEGWRRKGNGPPFLRLSATVVRYPVPGFREFVAARTFTSTAAETARA